MPKAPTELVFLDITASVENRRTLLSTVQSVAEKISIPLTVGGGVKSVPEMNLLLRAGADKSQLQHRRRQPSATARRMRRPFRRAMRSAGD